MCGVGWGWACRRGNVKLSHEKKGLLVEDCYGVTDAEPFQAAPPSMSKEWRGPKIGTLLPWGREVLSILFFSTRKKTTHPENKSVDLTSL